MNPPKALLDGPAVLLNALPEGLTAIPSVVPDEAEAGRTAVRVLLDAGHTDGICLVGAGPKPARAPKDSIAAVERLQGITEALESAGAEIAGAVGCSEWQPEDGFEATRRLLRRKSPPSAPLRERGSVRRREATTGPRSEEHLLHEEGVGSRTPVEAYRRRRRSGSQAS